ncbi:MAG: homocysteine S-methyltransferase [Gemmatimonadetes bacterium]|nr:homocysteine S-methyltransferase [Gemmatimonadota bacterium]NNM06084.1 homocysteine S-methyltransferase [Gemmatimonadota bacterium]
MTSNDQNPILRFLEKQGVLFLDGGLATALEARGCDLLDELWSAKVLAEAPDLIREVHLDYLLAGADCITSASYQATLPGFRNRGLDDEAGRSLLRLSLTLALEAREAFWSDPTSRGGRLEPLVAASIGPYGAFLADGSEYTGDYDISDSELLRFHRERWDVLAEGGADLFACETIPTLREAEVLLRLVAETPGQWAWLSFSCRDGKHLCDGGRLRDAVRVCGAEPRVAAVGVNCTAPEYVASLIGEARMETDGPILVYPNSGEEYNAARKKWHSDRSSQPMADAAGEWVWRGASGVGGCCRVGPGEIARIRRALMP